MQLSRQELLTIIRGRLLDIENSSASMETLEKIATALEIPETPAVRVTYVDPARKIRAIKNIRQYTGLGLADAKRCVEQSPPFNIELMKGQNNHALARALREDGIGAEAVFIKA